MMASSDSSAARQPASPAEEVEEEEDEEEEEDGMDESFAIGLREISPLASWTVSTYKPGCGVAALLSPSTTQFWQSDGPQPHLLNVHFFKRVSIVCLRIYLDIDLDESYTPTRMLFLAGHSEYDAVEFAEWRAPSTPTDGPKGWVNISLENCYAAGSTRDSEDVEDSEDCVLRCMFLQVRVLENFQNGKDTHIRGIQILARDEREGKVTRKNLFEKALPTAETAERKSGALLQELWFEGDLAESHIR